MTKKLIAVALYVFFVHWGFAFGSSGYRFLGTFFPVTYMSQEPCAAFMVFYTWRGWEKLRMLLSRVLFVTSLIKLALIQIDLDDEDSQDVVVDTTELGVWRTFTLLIALIFMS